MFESDFGIRRVILCCGFVDLRKGIEGLSTIVGSRFHLNPYEKGSLFLFCGRRTDRIKGLLWTGLGFLLLYLRFEEGRLSWPRTPEEAADLSEDQFHLLMRGYNPLETRVREAKPKKIN
jgi:transposase